MKTITSLLLLFIGTLSAPGQSLELLQSKDIMTGTEYITASKNIVLEKDEQRITIIPVIDNQKYLDIMVMYKGINRCSEKNTLIILFEDSTKITLTSWTKFNCESWSNFDFKSNLLEKLQKPIIAAMFINGRTNDSFTSAIPIEYKDYFIELKKLIDARVYVPAHIDSDGRFIKN